MADSLTEINLSEKVLKALKWAFIGRVVGQLVSWAITILVVRILTPHAYGLIAIASVTLAFLYLINDASLESCLIRQRYSDEKLQRQIFGFVLLLNLSIFVVLICVAPTVSEFFNEPELVFVIRVLAIQFLFFPFETLPRATLHRDLNLEKISILEAGATIFGGILTLLLALSGAGVWALIWGQLFSLAIRAFGLNVIAPCLLRPIFSLQGLNLHFRFGGLVSLDRVLWFLFAEVDKLIAGRIMGVQSLGYFVVSNDLASLPINKFAAVINSVAFPAFSVIQHEPNSLQQKFLNATRMLSITTFPLFIGLASVAPEFVRVFLGKQWLELIAPLQILALVMPFRMIATIFQPVLWGVGKPAISAINYLIAILLMVPAFIGGAFYGARGLAMAWAVGFPIVFLIMGWKTARAIDLEPRRLFEAMARPGLAVLLMYLTIGYGRHLAVASTNPILQLIELIGLGIAAYVLFVLMVARDDALSIVRLLRKF